MSSTDTLFSEASSTVDPRAAAALHRLERAVAGEQVPPAMTNLDKTVDWYAAHLREQIRDYLTLAAEDLLARANEAAAQAQAQADAYDFITAAMNRIRAKACEGIGSAVMGAFGVVKGIHVRHVPAAPRTGGGEKPKITKWSDGPAASITFEKAP